MTRKPSSRSHAFSEGAPERGLNLIPMMNLICLLIPFLLLSAAFIKVAVVEVNQPTTGPSPSSGDESTEPRFTLTITDQGYMIFVNSKKLEGRFAGPTLPLLPSGEYDDNGLRFMAQEIKNQDPTKSQIMLSAEPDVPYEALIDVMDAVRENLDHEPLFPEVVMANVL